MRLGIVADIHANASALDAVLADGRAAGVDRWVCLGDVVGYGPDPGTCLRRLRGSDVPCLQGNHEARLLDLPTGPFNPMAEAAIDYCRDALDDEDLEQIRSFPARIRWGDDVLFCHGSPDDRDEYLLLETRVRALVAGQSTWLVFCGHTHQQFVFDGDRSSSQPGTRTLERSRRYLVNPGSVGQPRDGDPRAAYALMDFDSASLQLRRVRYDVETQIRRTREAGLHTYLGDRLRQGW